MGPQGPGGGGTSPAAPGRPDRSGKEARGRIVTGLALEMARIAIPLLGNSEDGIELANFVAKFGKRFVKPPQDLGQSELKFMGSQLFGGGGAPPGAQAPPQGGASGGMPPTPPIPTPMAA